MRNLIIGIDPDCNKSGVAVINQDTGTMFVATDRFFELYYRLMNVRFAVKLVVIEAGWMNKSNYHSRGKFSAAMNAKIGEKVGANFETSKKIAEMCQYLEIPYREIKPLPKNWVGPDKKITSVEFNKITKMTCRTNQEERDAGLIALAYRNTK